MRKSLINLLAAIFILTSCTAAPSPQVQPGQIAVPDAALHLPSTATRLPPTRPPTYTPLPSPTVTRTRRPTITPAPTYTPDPLKPTTARPTPTVAPATAVPLVEGNRFYHGLKERGYSLQTGTSIIGPQGYTYSAYLFFDSTIHSFDNSDYFFRKGVQALETEGCRVAIYRLDGIQNDLLYSFGAPQYPAGTFYSHYPIRCDIFNWEEAYHWFGGSESPEVYQALSLENNWSDINQNGLPELAVYYQYCSDACLDWGAIDVHLYEIQSTAKVVDITAELPGVILPFYFVHSLEPLRFRVYDPTLWYCHKWCVINTWWIYAWDGEKLVDVTVEYPELARQRGAEIVASLQEAKTDQGFLDNFQSRIWKVLQPLFIYEKAGMSQEGLDLFLDLTDPADWTVAQPRDICWLQVARAAMQEDFANGQPFHLLTEYSMDEELQKVDPSKYDISRCAGIEIEIH